jgi:hypothetical protein
MGISWTSLRNCDVYGHQPSLTFNRKERYGTALGGFYSVTVKILMAVISVYLIWKMVVSTE